MHIEPTLTYTLKCKYFGGQVLMLDVIAVVQGKREELSCDLLILGVGYCILSGFLPNEGCN
jgi:hypothetical protein